VKIVHILISFSISRSFFVSHLFLKGTFDPVLLEEMETISGTELCICSIFLEVVKFSMYMVSNVNCIALLRV